MTIQRIYRWLPLAVLCWAALPNPTWAQVDTTRTALPDIAPREVEILGQLEISLPSLQRQPLIGFNPPPRVPRPPDGRLPYAETYKQSSADLPASPLRRPQPPSALGTSSQPAEGLVETLAGRYFSRTVKTRLQAPVADRTTFLLQADYRGSEGAEPFAELPDVNASYDAVEGLVGIQSARARWATDVTMDGFYEAFDLYGVQPVNLPVNPDVPPSLPGMEREGRGLQGTLGLSTLADTPVDARLEVSYGSTRYETQGNETGITELAEQRFHTTADLGFTTPVGDAWLDGTASTATLADDLGSYAAVDAGGGLLFEFGSALTLRVGARFLGAFSDTEPVRDEPTETLRIGYLSPDVRLEFLPRPGLRVYALNRPNVSPNAVADVYRTNPYLAALPILRPTLRAIDAEAGVNYFVGPVQFAARVGFQDMPQYMYFEDDSDGTTQGMMALRYEDAAVLQAGGSVSVVLPGGVHAMVGAAYRDGRLRDSDAAIPYFSPIVGEATLSYAFAQRRGLLQAIGHVESPRYIDRTETTQVGTYVDLDLEGSYKITPALGVIMRIENISGNDNALWDAYPESPVIIGAGLQIGW